MWNTAVHLLLLERSQLVGERVWVGSGLLPPQSCCSHLPLSTTPVTGPPQFPAWLGSTAVGTSLQEVSLPPQQLGHPKGQCWRSLSNTDQPGEKAAPWFLGGQTWNELAGFIPVLRDRYPHQETTILTGPFFGSLK